MADGDRAVWQLIEHRAAASPEDRLVVDEQDRELTFGGLHDRALSVAAGLYGLGIGEGSVVSWEVPTWIESVVLVAALARLGAVQNPIIPMNREREVSFITGQIGTELLIVPDTWRQYDFSAMAAAVAKRRQALKVCVLADRALPEGDPEMLPPPPTNEGDRVRWILFTSGTTADPKGARHTDGSLLTSSRNMSARMHAVPADRIAIAFPFAHIGGLALFFVNLLVGCSSILVDQFGDEGIETLARHGVTLAGSGTPFNLAYLRAQRQAGSRRIFPAVRAFPGGGSTRPPGLHRQMQEVFGAGILSGYGLTETGFLAMADIDDPDEALATTEGRPYPDSELRIVDPVGRLCDRGQEGEICARGPMVMAGYSDRALDSAFDSAGFFHTGDLGRIDSEGFLHLTGRIKDIIIRKGENISAREVEEILNEHPGIEESAVIGVPDPDTGERCCAVVVPSHGASDPTLVEIGGYLRDAGLSVYKIPERLEVVDSLPKNASGKITKHVLIRQFTADEVSSGH